MPIDFSNLRGLKASDRTEEEQKAINQQMGYKEKEEPEIATPDSNITTTVAPDNSAAAAVDTYLNYQQHLNEEYEKALAERREEYGVQRNSVNSNVNDYLDKIASNASSYYKKYKNTDKLPLTEQQKKDLAASYDARKEVYGEQSADIWLDSQFKNIVGTKQPWWEQAINGLSHLIPAIEGGAIQTYGMLHGAINHIAGTEGYGENEDLNWWDSFVDDVLDNPITRYGRDVEHAGASNVVQGLGNLIGIMDETAAERIAATKASATKYNPEGIGHDAIITTQEQDESLFSSATPWQALQSGGFTALSMLTGAAEAKVAGWLFGGLARGANWLNKTGRILKTEEGLRKTLEGIKKIQNFTDIAIIPGAVGSVEGAMEGLNTKIEVEREAVDNLDEYYRNKVSEEAEALYNNDKTNPLVAVGDGTFRRVMTPDDAYKQVWDKYQQEYIDARRQIDWASSKAGIHNFWANSMINGMMNTTLKAGLMAPRVQETLRNSKMFGWAYGKPKFNINTATGEVTPKLSKLGMVKQILKEPIGEGGEEYLQSLSSDVFSAAAENNIDEFIKNKFEEDGTAKVTDSFGSDYAAALTALKGSLTNKESIQSAILGAVSSTMGTVGGIGRGYHRDENGKLVENSLLDARNLRRGLNAEGQQESWGEYMRRVTPWRSGLINAYYDRRREEADAKETAANLTEWLKDPQNKAKWDGLVGTANWMTQMENAAESNDQFSYRKAQMGKAVNDVIMLSKLQGTDYYDSMIADLQRAASGELTQNDIQKLKENGGEDYQGVSDQEIVEKVQSNANKMLGLMTQVEREGRNLDRLLGRVDEDTKQSLIFGKIMQQDFQERRDQLQEEIDTIRGRIESSIRDHTGSFPESLKKLILRYGSLNKALKAESDLQEQKERTKKKIEELKAIDSKKTSDKQKEEILKSQKQLKDIDKELENLNGLRDENGEIYSGISQLVLSEQDIMSLDPITRAWVLANGATKLYNATHQDRHRVEQLNMEIDELNHQMDALQAQRAAWITSDGKVKKGHNKQYERNSQKVAELEKQKTAKMRALDAVQGSMDAKPIYSSQQQEVIDNLMRQGMAQDENFLDKVVDMGRLEKGIRDYNTQYQAILSDPNAFRNYVKRAKYNAQRDITRRRAERVAGIQNFQEYSQELDRLTANASQQEVNEIFDVLRNEDRRVKALQAKSEGMVDADTGMPIEPVKSNYDRYIENVRKQGDLVRQFAKNPNLTDNDQSLLLDAMQYLSSKGIDVTDREAAVQALLENDAQGNQGGKFREWVEAKNSALLPQQRAFMPVFTTIGQVVSQYVDIINGQQQDAVNRGNIQPTVQPASSATSTTGTSAPAAQLQPAPTISNTPSPSPSPATQPQPAPQGSIFDRAGGATPEAGHFVDDNGTVATGTQTQVVQQKQEDENQPEKTARQLVLEQVTTPEIAKAVDDSSHLIDTSNVSPQVKALATQYLEDIAVVNDETYSTLDEFMDAVLGQINKLREKADMEENSKDTDYYKAAGLLNKVYGSLNAKKIRGRGRTLPVPSSRPVNPRASWIHSANIAYMEQKNPDAWAVRFTNDHAIDEWNRDHVIDSQEPVYFLTDSEWTAEVTAQMNGSQEGKKYDTLTDMPIVAAVKVDTPQNPAATTAIEVNGQWYQPIGIMPGSKSMSVQGAAMTEEIRKVASKEQGRHIVTEDGLPSGNPLITRVYGANYLEAHHPDSSSQSKRQNTSENNTDVIEGILDTLPRDSQERLRALSKQDMLSDSEYQEARGKFLNGLNWNGEGTGVYENQVTYTPDNHREGEQGSPMLVFRRPMSETTARDSDKTLPEVLENGTLDEVVTFNSRVERLYSEVVRPLFQHNPITDHHSDRSAKLVTQQDIDANPNVFQEEADRLTKMLKGYDGTSASSGIKGISDFIYINPKEGWEIIVTAPESLQTIGSDVTNSESVYKIYLRNNDPSIAPVELGELRVNAQSDNTPAAKQFVKNLMWDSTAGQVRGFIEWQVPKNDVQNLKNPDASISSKAKRNYAAIVDDGILSFAGSTLVYDVDGVKLKAPIVSDDQGHTRIVYPYAKTVNTDNAQTPAPQNVTPQGDGAVVTAGGQQVVADSGAALEERSEGNTSGTPVKSANLIKAEEITRRIIEDSKQFTLSEDETYYYIRDNVTGEETKYLRVTTVIGADESVPQWTPTIKQIYDKLRERHALQELSPAQLATFKTIEQMSQDLNIPVGEIRRAVAELRTVHKKEKYGAWGLPSTSIGNTADRITRDFFNGDFYMVGMTIRPDETEHYSANSRLSRSEANEHKLEEIYPNATRESIAKFVYQLSLFKNDLDSRGIHIVPEGVMAHGTVTMTDAEGKSHDVKVAGTLDLFGYDDEGNFYIFDMKTTRNHSTGKLQQEKAKWSRQISMYADLLKQTYGIEVSPERLRIIPIDVDYPTPMGERQDHLDPLGPQYSETSKGQLMLTYRGSAEAKPFDGSNLTMRGTTFVEQFPPGYTPFNINWDNLSSEDQDIASALIVQTGGQDVTEEAPASAIIETPQEAVPAFVDTGSLPIEDTQDAVPQTPPVVPSGQVETLPQWKDLSNAAIGYLADNEGITSVEDYNEMLNDPEWKESVEHALRCRELI